MGNNIIKQKAFNERMGMKIPRHLKLSKGGMIVHKYADGGVTTSNNLLPTAGATGVNQNAANPNTGIGGTIGGILGTNNNFQATGANLQAGTTGGQLNDAYTGAQTGLANQNNLASTLQPQAGSAVTNQNAVANQLLAMSQGQGPNPAQTQLAQATGQNVANQAALAAGQRGASANVGLLARQAAQTGAATQQAAAGQAATLEAQQQIAAQQNLANLSNQQVTQVQGAVAGQNASQQGEQGILQGANTALNSTNAGMQSNINTTNAQTAGQNTGIAGNIIGGVSSAISSLFSEGGEVSDHIKMAEMNAQSLAHHRKNFAFGPPVIAPNPLLGNQTNGAPLPAAAQAQIPGQAQPGQTVPFQPNMFNQANSGQNLENGLSSIGSAIGRIAKGSGGNDDVEEDGDLAGGAGDEVSNIITSPGAEAAGDSALAFASEGGELKFKPHPPEGQSFIVNHMFSKGGEVPAKVSPGEIYLRPDQVRDVVHKGANPLKIGYRFPGKAKVKGDSRKNDDIPTTLEDGGVVIKRTVVNSKSPEKAALFVHRAHAKAGR